jgi:hypothetical protein
VSMFVHIGDARTSRSFRRAGIRVARRAGEKARGVFAMPVMANYFASHQWLREAKRGGVREMVGVYFRIPDHEPVIVGHYNSAHLPMTAARAVRLVMAATDPRGYQVIVPRAILAEEVHAVRAVSRVVGWRYYPDAHGKAVCGCPVCLQRGAIKSRRLREAYKSSMQMGRSTREAG